eukprot:scaffold114116_cov28-Tisochrysis_lutea.AAC.3
MVENTKNTPGKRHATRPPSGSPLIEYANGAITCTSEDTSVEPGVSRSLVLNGSTSTRTNTCACIAAPYVGPSAVPARSAMARMPIDALSASKEPSAKQAAIAPV